MVLDHLPASFIINMEARADAQCPVSGRNGIFNALVNCPLPWLCRQELRLHRTYHMAVSAQCIFHMWLNTILPKAAAAKRYAEVPQEWTQQVLPVTDQQPLQQNWWTEQTVLYSEDIKRIQHHQSGMKKDQENVQNWQWIGLHRIVQWVPETMERLFKLYLLRNRSGLLIYHTNRRDVNSPASVALYSQIVTG